MDLSADGRVASLPRRRFQALAGASLLQGTVGGVGRQATEVIDAQGSALRLAERSLVDVVPGDVVRFRRGRDELGGCAYVQAVLKAQQRRVLGALELYGDRWVLQPLRRVPGLSGGVFLSARLEPPEEWRGGLAWGRLPAFDPAIARPEVDALEFVGAPEHPRAAMAVRIERAQWPGPFSERAEAAARSFEPAQLERRDFRDRLIFTIDPESAKDHDDAVSVEELDGGGFRLSVHIADVACHVEEGGVVDEEALVRCTSVYPPGRVLPMLPEALSADRCSLHHGSSRLCLSVEMDYDKDGKRQRIQMGRSIIESAASLSYEDAQSYLDREDFAAEASRLSQGVEHADLRGAIRSMYRLTYRLRECRREAGSLFLERPEREFVFDDDGHVLALKLRASLESHWIIEEFMLEANRAVAETLHQARYPLLWRVHGEPDPQKIQELAELIETLGVRWTPDEPVSTHDFMELLARIHGRPDAGVLHLLVLRTMMKAEYKSAWDRHFGLGFAEYTHFTSPIRRYPDLHNQRWLHRLIETAGGEGWLSDASSRARRGAKAAGVDAASRERNRWLAERCSELERAASLIERDCADICGADYLKPQEGNEFGGIIISLVARGFFVELDGLGIDGFVGLDQLPRDWYSLDGSRQAFVGETRGRRFGLGQRLRVQLEYVDVRNGRLWLGYVGVEDTHGRRETEKGSKRGSQS